MKHPHLFTMERPVNGIEPDTFANPSAFQPLPAPTGKPPFHLDIKTIISPAAYNALARSKKIIFQTAGDTGGVHNPADQQIVADHMEWEFDKQQPANSPSFFYHLGDIVYYFGKASGYSTQFYEPYKFYPAPIVGIPGNHDGNVDPTDPTRPKSLAAFMRLFCSEFPMIAPESLADDALRTTMVQPNPYWTFVTPVANMIGLYTNVPGGGEVGADQKKWFISELKAANKERDSKALIVALHHPPYSMDGDIGASSKMQQLLDDSFAKAAAVPDIVLSGHVHNYQRFTRTMGNRQLPYIVAGAGGYWHLHGITVQGKPVIKPPVKSSFKDVVFEKYSEDRHGFLTIEIDMGKKELTGKYMTVPRSQESWKAPSVLFDSFTVDLAKNKVK
ncbi:MAG: metallophosphoesterase [Bacteroidota bacterium]